MNHKLYPNGVKTLLVERNIKCPTCSKELKNGDTMYKDCYRGDTFCGYCIEDYEDAIIIQEGEDGRLLK